MAMRRLGALSALLLVLAALSAIPARASVSPPPAAPAQAADIPGLVGYWSLDEGSGDVAHNVISGVHDGAVANAAWAAGRLGQALRFDGDGDYVEIAGSGTLSLTNALTLAAWVRPERLCAWNNPIIQLDNSYGLKVKESGHAVGFVWGGSEEHLSTTQIVTGTWYHLAATFAGGVHRTYVNGVLESEESDLVATIPAGGDPLRFGAGAYGCDFAGTIDEVYIYRAALTGAQIQLLHQAEAVPDAPAGLRPTAASEASLSLTWDDTSANEQGFHIYRWDAAAQQLVHLGSTAANATAFTDTGLECGRSYAYEVSAYNAAGESAHTARVQAATAPCTTAYAVYLPCLEVPDLSIPVASVLTPFDANLQDLSGPASWDATYGKSPEIIVASNGAELDVLAQDYDPATPWSAVLLHIRPGAGGYRVSQALTGLPMLERVMGLATDAAGNRYYATGVDEAAEVNSSYPPLNTYRSNIVRVVKVDPAGAVQFNVDLDVARHAFNSSAEMIINPMDAATARLAVGGGEVALVHGINTDPDWNIGGARHQKALSTRLNATSGAVTATSSVWVSHSFDQRLLFDGEGIVEHHLGDAFPRSLVVGRDGGSSSVFHIKGALGENNTYTRLGNLALIAGDAQYRYIALFATESNPSTDAGINGSRNLAIVRIKGSDGSVDPSLPDTLTVTSAGAQQTNRLRWLTSYPAGSNLHAERPKLVGIGGNRYVVLWEEWRVTGEYSDAFNGVYGMVIDDRGAVLRPAQLITSQHHLPRGDDAFLLGGRAGWMTGDAAGRALSIHLVDENLAYELVRLN